MRYEYERTRDDSYSIDARLKKRGNDGWQMCGYSVYQNDKFLDIHHIIWMKVHEPEQPKAPGVEV